MAKLRDPVVDARLFENVFVCMKCNTKQRAQYAKVTDSKIKCRKCGYRGLRPKSKVIRVVGGAA